MRLEKVYVNGEAYYREIPEDTAEESQAKAETPPAQSLYERAKEGTRTALASARAFGKRLGEGADALGKRIGTGVRTVFPSKRKGGGCDEIGELVRLLPHLDADGRHEVYLTLSKEKCRLDRVQLGALLPYLEKEDFDALCRIYREENV